MAMLSEPGQEPLARESLLFISSAESLELPVQNLTARLLSSRTFAVGGSYFFRLYSEGFGRRIAHRFSRVGRVRWRRENGS